MNDPRKFKIYRNKKGWTMWYQPYLEAWWIITGKWSLHKAWNDGVFHGSRMEYTRLITNEAYKAEILARGGISNL